MKNVFLKHASQKESRPILHRRRFNIDHKQFKIVRRFWSDKSRKPHLKHKPISLWAKEGIFFRHALCAKIGNTEKVFFSSLLLILHYVENVSKKHNFPLALRFGDINRLVVDFFYINLIFFYFNSMELIFL